LRSLESLSFPKLSQALLLEWYLTYCLSQTIESTREKDETMVAVDDAEVQADEAQDEFAGNLAVCTS